MSSVMADAAAVGNVGEAAALPGGPSRRQSRRAPAASDDDSDGSSSSTTPPRERAKRELVDSLLNLEKRQRRDDTARLDPVAIADLGRQVLRGQYLRAWQTVIEDQPRWVWEEDAETPEDENAIGSDLDNLEIGVGALRVLKAALVRVWRQQVAEENPELTQRQLGGRQGAFLRGLQTCSWAETLRAARHSLRLSTWRRWVEQVRIVQAVGDP